MSEEQTSSLPNKQTDCSSFQICLKLELDSSMNGRTLYVDPYFYQE